MGKKAITILMTVTVVVALFSFGSLVALRPGTEDGAMGSLFAKSEPAPVVEEAAQTVAVSEQDILDAVTDSDELRAIVRDEVAEKINDIALEGAEVDVDLLRNTILHDVSEALIESELQAMEALEVEAEELRAENRELRTGLESLQAAVDELIARQDRSEEKLQALEDSLRSDVTEMIDQKIEDLKNLFASADRAVYESVIDELVLLEDDIYAYIDSEISREIAEIQIMPIESGEAVPAEIDEERLVEIFAENILRASRSNTGDTVYDEIVYNVASDVMAMLAQEDAKAYGELTEYRDASYDVIERVVNEILDRLAGIETFAEVEEPVEEVTEPVAEDAVVEEPVEEVAEEPAAEEVTEEPAVEEPAVEEPVEETVPEAPKTPVIQRPGFSFDNTKIENTREDARDAAISGVIDALKGGQL